MEKRLSEVHSYWFGDSGDDLESIEQKSKLWFSKNDDVDQYIREQFEDLVALASKRMIDCAALEPRRQLTVILLLDQFTRNLYRDDQRSFATDFIARELAGTLLMTGAEVLRPLEKVFLYLPLEHSENLDDQKKSVALYRHLYTTVDENLKETFAGFYDYSVRHHDIIARFGRFPHRNKILGRTSSAEELIFLTQPGSSF